MKRTREQRRAELIAEATAVIDELLAWEEQAEAPNLAAMEVEVLKLRQRLLAAVIEDQEARQLAEAPLCPQCGLALRYKGQKGANLESRLGGLEVERGYYYCARCQCGLFPPE